MRRALKQPLVALAMSLFDRGNGIPHDRLSWTIADVESFLDHAGARTSFLFALALTALELLPLVLVRRPSRMSRLKPDVRLHYLEALDRSFLAGVLLLPKAVLSLVYYEHPDALKETGYDETCLLGDLPEGVGLVQIAGRARARGR
jgi:hypothetical protein